MNLLSFLGKNVRTNKMRIFLTDDHSMLLDGLENVLISENEFEVVGTATTIQEASDKLTYTKADLLITDYNLPDGDGLSLVQKVKREYPEMKIIVLSMHDEAHLVKEILKEGVDGYILKKDSHKELLDAVRSVRDGKIHLSNEINRMLVTGLDGQAGEKKLLTSREREVLKLISQEYTNKKIAEELFISERTVETHRKNIFRKTGTNNLVGLIKYAYANNLI